MAHSINNMKFKALSEQNAYLNYLIGRALELESIEVDVKYYIESVDDDTLVAMQQISEALEQLTEIPYLGRLIQQAKEEDFTLLQ